MVAAARQRHVGGNMAEHCHWSSRHTSFLIFLCGVQLLSYGTIL
jgi:hypothetical protein